MNLEIANRLLALRREHGYSQEELAYKLGVSRQAVSKWERAESSPDTDNLLALARLYGVSLDALLLHTPAGEAAQAAPEAIISSAAPPEGCPAPGNNSNASPVTAASIPTLFSHVRRSPRISPQPVITH